MDTNRPSAMQAVIDEIIQLTSKSTHPCFPLTNIAKLWNCTRDSVWWLFVLLNVILLEQQAPCLHIIIWCLNMLFTQGFHVVFTFRILNIRLYVVYI